MNWSREIASPADKFPLRTRRKTTEQQPRVRRTSGAIGRPEGGVRYMTSDNLLWGASKGESNANCTLDDGPARLSDQRMQQASGFRQEAGQARSREGSKQGVGRTGSMPAEQSVKFWNKSHPRQDFILHYVATGCHLQHRWYNDVTDLNRSLDQ